MLSVAAITGGITVPSARFRVRQYIAHLKRCDISLDEFYSSFGSYPPRSRAVRPIWAVLSLAERLPAVTASYRYDLTLLQREMLSGFVTLERCTARPRVLDVDDAIFLLRGGGFAKRIAAECNLVICGNTWLAENFSQWNTAVAVLPTAIDTERYRPADVYVHDVPVIGWIGTGANMSYLYDIEDALSQILRHFPQAQLRVISDIRPVFRSIAADRVEYLRWNAEREVADIQTMSVGLMPLRDSSWERGKCSFKMLQYLACGVPAVVSPVGMNREVAALGEFALIADKPTEWSDRISACLSDPVTARQKGLQGRSAMEQYFSVERLTPRFADLLYRAAGVQQPEWSR